MKNKTFTYPEYIDQLLNSPYFGEYLTTKDLYEGNPFDMVVYYRGKLLLFLNHKILVWYQCEYCNTTITPDISEDGNYVICSKCGAPNS